LRRARRSLASRLYPPGLERAIGRCRRPRGRALRFPGVVRRAVGGGTFPRGVARPGESREEDVAPRRLRRSRSAVRRLSGLPSFSARAVAVNDRALLSWLPPPSGLRAEGPPSTRATLGAGTRPAPPATRRSTTLLGFFRPSSASGAGDPLHAGPARHPPRSDLGVSHALVGLLPPAPSGPLGPVTLLGFVTFRGLLLPVG